MSKHPLTDEEKQRLEQILTDIDTCQSGKDTSQMNEEKAEKTNADDSPNLAEHNAFIFNENDKKRLTEIDFELKNCYSETQHLRTTETTLTDNFWKSLILDQMLKNIDEKLGNIRHEDKITNPELQDSEPY
ncbi:hypothetical protein Zmor_001447 [Zophobas morio]|uniref:Uncharacterized protein n=1 Tax=Zophobas morio TaxID=2755281 RepID=A0AA38IZ31_9CUCU|nr:hypothetical protein Zmor_001447 [Zophobas morio]